MRRELRCSLPFLFEELGCSEEEKEEEEEGLFKPKAVNEEDPERDRATPALKVWTTALRPEGRLTPISPCYCTREYSRIALC